MNIGATIRASRSGQLKRMNPRGSNKSFSRRYDVPKHIETLCIVLVNAGKMDSVTNDVINIAKAGTLIELRTQRTDGWLDVKSPSCISPSGYSGIISSASNGCVRSLLLEDVGSSISPLISSSALCVCDDSPDANRR